MKPSIYRQRSIKLALLALILLLSACSGELPDKVWLQAPGWSRGVRAGSTSLNTPVPLDLDPEGNLWLLTLHGQAAPELLKVAGDGAAIDQFPLPDLAGHLRQSPAVRWTQEGVLLSWIEADQLMVARLRQDFSLESSPRMVSADRPVAFFDVAVRPDGELELWFSGGEDEPGIYRVRLDGAGSPQQVSAAGIKPDIQIGQDGQLHAVWIEKPPGQGRSPIMYWAEDMAQPQQLAAPNIQSSDVFQGPLFGSAADQGYLFYVISIRTGLRAGQVDPMMISFPLESPSSPRELIRLAAPASYELSYDEEPDQGLALGPRANLESTAVTNQLTEFDLPDETGAELPLALRARVDFLMNQNQGQIGLLTMEAGQPRYYQLLTFTSGNSQRPSLDLDQAGYAYLTWIETSDAEESSIYIASSNPAWVQQFASLTADDLQRMLLQSLFGMASGIILIPMVLLWLIAPVVVILLSSFLRRAEHDWRHPLTWIPIGLAVLVYWLVKRGMLPAIFEYVPFSAWVPVIPAWLAPVLRFGLPLAGSALAGWLAFRMTFGQERNSPTFFILIFGAIDGLVTMMLYGGLFLGF